MSRPYVAGDAAPPAPVNSPHHSLVFAIIYPSGSFTNCVTRDRSPPGAPLSSLCVKLTFHPFYTPLRTFSRHADLGCFCALSWLETGFPSTELRHFALFLRGGSFFSVIGLRRGVFSVLIIYLHASFRQLMRLSSIHLAFDVLPATGLRHDQETVLLVPGVFSCTWKMLYITGSK